MVLYELSQMSLSSSSWDSSESRVKISTVAAFLPLPAACPRKRRFPGPAFLQRVMALTTSSCDHSFSEAPLLHTAINSCRLSSSRATRFLSFRRFRIDPILSARKKAEKRDRNEEREKGRKRRFGVNAIIDWWWRWRRNVSFFPSLSLHFYLSSPPFSRAHYWVNKYILKMRVSSKELFSTLDDSVARSPAQRLRSGWAGRQQPPEELAEAEIVLARHATCPWAPGRTLDGKQMVQPNPTSPPIPLSAARPVAHSILLRASVPHGQDDLWERWPESLSPPHQNHPNPLARWSGYGREGTKAEYLWQVGMEKGSRRPLDLLRCPLGRKGVADFPPLRVCQVDVTRITRKVFKILNLVFGNLSFFSGLFQYCLFAHGTQRKTRVAKLDPWVEKLVAKLTTAAQDLVAKNIFWSQKATRRPDFSSPGEKDDREESTTKSLRGMTRPKDEMGSQIVSSESDVSHPIFACLSLHNNSQAQARRF